MATARVPDAPLARREAVRLGVRTVMPLAVGALPFGIVFGVTAASSSLTWWEGLVASALIMAGAAQLALVDLIDTDTPWLLAVVTALIINARFLLYSTALAPAFRRFPVRWRYGLAHLMTDQAAVTGIDVYAEPFPHEAGYQTYENDRFRVLLRSGCGSMPTGRSFA